MPRRYRMDRRSYLRAVGAAGLATGLAGCLGEDGAATDTPTPTEGDTGTATATPTPEATEITPGTAPGFPPFEFFDENQELVGFDIDLLEAVVAETESYTLAGWREFEFDSLIPALTSNNLDVIAAAMTINEERAQTIAFSDPYYNADQSIIVREGEGDQYSQLSDLAGSVVGAQSGTTGEDVVQDELIAAGHIQEGDYRAFDNYVLAVQSLENGDVDVIVIDLPVGETFEDQRAVEVAFVHETDEEYGFGVRQDDDDLLAALNEGLAVVQESSRYEELRNQWFGEG